MATKRKYNFTFFQDFLREKRNGKYSSKKVWGTVIMILVSLAFVVDGMQFYTVNTTLFNSMLLAGASLLGLRSIASLFKKDKPAVDE